MDFSKLDGLIPAVVQDEQTNEVLMVGFMNDEAWKITQEIGYVTFFSRTRNTLLIKAAREGDGNVCHTGARTCFYTEVTR
jgi:phosphoribosyl-ATP pyrophosphohydrolase/phosphoribosyl-AMP cyclohydrolase